MFSPQEWLAAGYPFGLSFHCRIRNTPEREARDGSADSVDLKRVIRGFRPVDVAIATSLTECYPELPRLPRRRALRPGAHKRPEARVLLRQ